MDFRADLHCHSHFSDGTFSPLELLLHAKEKGLSGLSITDHDTVKAYTPELFKAAKEMGISMLCGVEFSCEHHGINVHLLGYNMDIENEALLKLCEKHTERRRQRNRGILEKLTKIGMPITEEELLAKNPIGVIGRPHIALLLMEKGYISTFQEGFHKYIGNGKSCYVKGPPFSVEETLSVLHRANGKAFIAHPHLIAKKSLIKDLLQLPFDGLECYYALFHREQVQSWLNLAKEKNLLISGGSDFHGEIKPQIPLGCSWVDRETFDRILT